MEIILIIISCLFIAIEITMIVVLFFKIKRYHRLTLKDTIVYPIVLLLTIITLLLINFYYLKETGINAVFISIKDSVSIITLEINKEVLLALENYNSIASKFILSTYIGEYIVSALALLSISISLVLVSFWSIFRRIKNFLSIKNKEVDYILGFNEDVKEYVKTYYEEYVSKDKVKKRNHRLVVVLDSSVINNYEKEKFYLHKHKTPFRTRPYSHIKDIGKTIKRLTGGKRAKRIISFLDDDKQNFLVVSEALKYVKENKNDVKFIVVANTNQELFLKNIIYKTDSHEKTIDESDGRINIFNKHDLISLEFIKNHNFAKYFPMEFVNDDLTISDDCDINLYFFGFGSVNQALLRDILITNQFIRKEKKEDKYILLPKRMNVEVYETKRKIESLELFNGILKYKKDKYQNLERFLDLPEDYESTVHLNPNVSIYEEKFINDLFNTIKKKANKGKYQINYFIISLDSDFVNCNVAKRLKSNFDHIANAKNTYFIRLTEDLFDIEENIISFGRSKDVLSYDNVVGNHIYDAANKFYYYYSDKQEYAKNSTPMEFKSNLYNVSSLYFKLSLLYRKKADSFGYSKKISSEEFIDTLTKIMEEYKIPTNFKQYGLASKKDSAFYNSLCDGTINDEFDIRDIFAFIEHERWIAYELSQGSLPMSKEYCEELLKYICEQFVNKKENELSELFCKFDAKNGIYKLKFNKSIDELYHLCLTTNIGLKQFYYFISELFSNYCQNYNLKDVSTTADVVYYDYKYMDVVRNDLYGSREMKDIYYDLYNYLTNEN